MSAFDVIVDALRTHGWNVKITGDGKASAQCPAHNGTDLNLKLFPRTKEPGTGVKCHSRDCLNTDILAAIGLGFHDTWDNPKMRQAYSPVRSYRYPGGRIVQRRGTGQGKKIWQEGNTKDTSLFGANLVAPGVNPIYIVEGERDAEVLHGLGVVAVSKPQGANTGKGSAAKYDWSPLTGHDVILVADKDEVGRCDAAEVAAIVSKIAKLKTVEAKVGKDIADHIAADCGLNELVPINLQFSAPPPAPAPSGPNFFDRDGLRALDLTRAVTDRIVCGFNNTDERFYVYDGGVWKPSQGHIETVVVDLLGNRYRPSHSKNVLELIQYGQDTPRISCEPIPQYINVRNGMLDWKAGKLLPHSPDYLSTAQLPIAHRPDAKCPRFDQFLRQVLEPDCIEPDGDSPGFIWELLGYTLYSGNPLHVAILLRGQGRNGKGTLIRVLQKLLGAENYSSAKLHDLAENRFRSAGLYGKLANLAGDLDDRWIKETATFKSITGGDSIMGEHKFGAAFNFTPWALPFYSANKAFGSPNSSEGWHARWVIVPFPHSFLGAEDRTLDTQLHTEPELEGILAKAAAAIPALMARSRLPEPPSIKQAKKEFIDASDAVRAWASEDCEFVPDAWTARTNLYQAYVRAARENDDKTVSSREFYGRIGQIGGVRPCKNVTNGFKGIRLRGQP